MAILNKSYIGNHYNIQDNS
uniref:Uncharacterized protein n=1 Tax=Rhizophora mucronata TaxID=61149 RepID=A0A2P2QID4_RHIMU